MPNSTVIQMDSYKKTRSLKELYDINECIIVVDQNIDFKIAGLNSASDETLEQQIERRNNLLKEKAELEKQIKELS